MSLQSTALTAAYGADTENFLDHIAWDEVIHPKLKRDVELLTRQLVDATLTTGGATKDTKEQIAGKIFGIHHAIKTIQTLVKEGRHAKEVLASQNIHLQ